MSTLDLRMSGVCLTFSWFTFHRNRGVNHEIVFNTKSNKNEQYFCEKFIVFGEKGFKGFPPIYLKEIYCYHSKRRGDWISLLFLDAA